MPLTGWVFDAVFISFNIPSYQKPSRSDLSVMEDFVLWAGPKGLAGASPENDQENGSRDEAGFHLLLLAVEGRRSSVADWASARFQFQSLCADETMRRSVSPGKLAVGEGIEPSTFRLTAGRCTNSTTPQQGV